jgi:hypothetical protein
MYLCLRIDLDYVPWDTPDAAEFGHFEPATLVRLLELARRTGYKLHFFASERALRAFPANGEAVLNDGHDLDWLCKRPEQGSSRFEEAAREFAALGHRAEGLAIRSPWPSEAQGEYLADLRFASGPPGPTPPGLRAFSVETKPFREAVRAGIGVRAWTDAVKAQLRETASRRAGITVVVRPQTLGKYDPKLSHLREILDLARAVDLPVRTLRDLVADAL